MHSLSRMVGLAGLAGLASASCNHNNCLRAIIADAFPTRDGLGDCASYLEAVGATGISIGSVTGTSYTTVTSTTTITTGGAGTVTKTVVDDDTVTVTGTVFATETDASVVDVITVATSTTETSTDYTATVTVTPALAPPKKRSGGRYAVQRRESPVASIPAYASSCPDEAHYISACSCAGPQAAAPTITITTVATAYAAGSGDATTTEVLTRTTTDSAVVTDTVEATATIVSTVSDVATSTAVVTAGCIITPAADPTVPPEQFRLRFNGTGNYYINIWADLNDPGFGGRSLYHLYQGDIGGATAFTLESDGKVRAVGYPAEYSYLSVFAQSTFGGTDVLLGPVDNGENMCTCSWDPATSALSCGSGPDTEWATAPSADPYLLVALGPPAVFAEDLSNGGYGIQTWVFYTEPVCASG